MSRRRLASKKYGMGGKPSHMSKDEYEARSKIYARGAAKAILDGIFKEKNIVGQGDTIVLSKERAQKLADTIASGFYWCLTKPRQIVEQTVLPKTGPEDDL